MFSPMDEKVIREELDEAGQTVKTEVYKHKDSWLQQYSETVQIVYSCLLNLATKETKEQK